MYPFCFGYRRVYKQRRMTFARMHVSVSLVTLGLASVRSSIMKGKYREVVTWRWIWTSR